MSSPISNLIYVINHFVVTPKMKPKEFCVNLDQGPESVLCDTTTSEDANTGISTRNKALHCALLPTT